VSSSKSFLIQGYRSEDYWDDFNKSEDREHEMIQIQKFFEEEIITKDQLVTFRDIEIQCNTYNIMIMGDLTYGTGNMITAKRLKSMFSDMGYTVYLYNVKYSNESSKEEEMIYINRLLNFMLRKKIHIVFGIHLWRSGRILNILREKKGFQVPYCLLIAGTDANLFTEVRYY
jgi:hypothetical protein